jgi:transposase
VSLRKIKEILRLHYDLGLGQDQSARSCQIGQATVHRYLERFAAAGVNWPLSADWDHARLEQLRFAHRRGRPPGPMDRPAPDFVTLPDELRKPPHLTLPLLWEEYRAQQPDGYGYSRFGDLYRRWQQSQDVVLRQEHRAGEKRFVDWAGAKIPLYPGNPGAAASASVLVAVLGASHYTFAYATANQDLPHWIEAPVRAFECFPGVPQLVSADHPRPGVERACRYEPDLNRSYHEMAQHDGGAVLPTRPYKPRDKAKVEVGVQIVQRWIVAALRHQRFPSVREVNEAISVLLKRLNPRRFRKREGTRASLFAELDRPALQPLPGERYQVSVWKSVRANLDYHGEGDRHYYSVPYQLRGQLLEARFTATTVEIFQRGVRLAWHPRSSAAYRHTSNAEHRPKSHQAPLEWTPSRLIHWAASAGPATAQGGGSHSQHQAASRDGLSLLSRYLALGQDLLGGAAGSRQSAGAATTSVFLSKPALDSQALARSPSLVDTRGPPLRPGPRKRARGRLLRCAEPVWAISHSPLKGHRLG